QPMDKATTGTISPSLQRAPRPASSAVAAIPIPASAKTRRAGALTPSEARVLRLIIDGLQRKQVAARLNRSPKTIEKHCMHIMQKFGARTMTRAAVLFDRMERAA